MNCVPAEEGTHTLNIHKNATKYQTQMDDNSVNHLIIITHPFMGFNTHCIQPEITHSLQEVMILHHP
jgi:hypothetical protein